MSITLNDRTLDLEWIEALQDAEDIGYAEGNLDEERNAQFSVNADLQAAYDRGFEDGSIG